MIIDQNNKLTKYGLERMGERLKWIMKNHSLTIREVSKICNIPRTTLSGWCEGLRPRNKEAFKRIIEIFNLNPDWLFKGIGTVYNEKGKPNVIKDNKNTK